VIVDMDVMQDLQSIPQCQIKRRPRTKHLETTFSNASRSWSCVVRMPHRRSSPGRKGRRSRRRRSLSKGTMGQHRLAIQRELPRGRIG